MITQTPRTITVRVNKQKFFQTVTVLPLLIIIMFAVFDTVGSNIQRTSSIDVSQVDVVAPTAVAVPVLGYPLTASELNPNLFSRELPPPALDALPYDVRKPLSNGESVPVKKRWVWIPPGQQIVISAAADGSLKVDIPVGSLWWKEFYIETDRGTFLIERRIIAKVAQTSRNPEGWVFYSSHHLSTGADGNVPLVISSTSDEAAAYMFQPNDWLPTKQESVHIEVRFEDARGVQYPYIFPGQVQCMACHGGSAGAYPNMDSDPVFVFGLHPNNLTPESFTAMVERGWITNGNALLTPEYLEIDTPVSDAVPLDTLTKQVVGVLRNNCASCHNQSSYAAARFTAFLIDPNYNYSTDELAELLGTHGLMVNDAFPLVTAGELERSEIWLRIHGLEGRRRMPPAEGGLPDIDPDIVKLLEAWITQLDEP